MDQFKGYRDGKADILARFAALKNIVHKLEEIGVTMEPALRKIESATHVIENDFLRIALIGAFSDGKTSVIAGWLGRVIDNMKIDTKESSDEIEIYRPDNLPEKCEIVDTPGLFGDKEKIDSAGETSILYSEITRRYVSEAHVVLYVVDATNPLKDSHKDVVKWIFRDLNKLSSTVFIINKMDEVSDLRDQEDFNHQEKIKKENLLIKLERFIDISKEERDSINIVCISANPNGKGLDFWFNNSKTYKERSRIEKLIVSANRILEVNTRDELLKKTGVDVIKELINQNLEIAKERHAATMIESEERRFNIQRIMEDIENGKREISAIKRDLFNELDILEKQLFNKVRSLEMEKIVPFLEDEIGYDPKNIDETGYKLRMRINIVIEGFSKNVNDLMKEISYDMEKHLVEIEKLTDWLSEPLLKGAGGAVKAIGKLPVDKIKKGVFAARDTIAKISGKAYKFKPWQATKYSRNISKWAGPLSGALLVLSDLLSIKEKQKAEKELEKVKANTIGLIKEHFKSIYDQLSSEEETIKIFAPPLLEFEKVLKTQKNALKEIEENGKILNNIKESLAKV